MKGCDLVLAASRLCGRARSSSLSVELRARALCLLTPADAVSGFQLPPSS